LQNAGEKQEVIVIFEAFVYCPQQQQQKMIAQTYLC